MIVVFVVVLILTVVAIAIAIRDGEETIRRITEEEDRQDEDHKGPA